MFYLNITRQLYFEYLFYALHHIHHSRRPGTIWLPVGLSDWLLWSCQADCLSHLYVCRVIRLTAMKLSCWVTYSWANQCCPVHGHMITHWQPLNQFCVTAHENGSANRPVGRYNCHGRRLCLDVLCVRPRQGTVPYSMWLGSLFGPTGYWGHGLASSESRH